MDQHNQVLWFSVRFLKKFQVMKKKTPSTYSGFGPLTWSCWPSNKVNVRCPDASAENGLQPGLLIEKPSVLLQTRVDFLPLPSSRGWNGEVWRASLKTDLHERVFVKSRQFINCRAILVNDLTEVIVLLSATLHPRLQFHLCRSIWKYIPGTYLCWPSVLWSFSRFPSV